MRTNRMVLGVSALAVVGAGALAAAAIAVGVWISCRGHKHVDRSDELCRAFLESPWVCSSPKNNTHEEAARALHIFSKSRGRAISLQRAREFFQNRSIGLKFACSSTNLFDEFLNAETATDARQTTLVEDVRVAFSKFADERGVHIGRRALSATRLRSALEKRGFVIDGDVVQGMACTLWC